jgi:hypothetical protein
MSLVQMPRQLQTLDGLLAPAENCANHSMRNLADGSQLIVGTSFVSDGWFWHCQRLKSLRQGFQPFNLGCQSGFGRKFRGGFVRGEHPHSLQMFLGSFLISLEGKIGWLVASWFNKLAFVVKNHKVFASDYAQCRWFSSSHHARWCGKSFHLVRWHD